MNPIRLAAAALAAAAFTTAGLAFAAAPAAAGQPAGIQLAQAQQFSDDKIESFALAALEVRKIRDDYVARIQQAETEDQRQQLAEEATGKMVEAVEAAPGITPEEYSSIIQAAAEDAQLTERINQRIQSAEQ